MKTDTIVRMRKHCRMTHHAIMFMKTLAAGLLLMCISINTAKAQKEQGRVYLLPQVGINSSWLNGNEVMQSMEENARKSESKAKLGLTAGIEAEYMVHHSVGIRAGMLYSIQGDKLDLPEESDLTTSLGYLCVPLIATLYVTDHVGLQAGVQYSRLLHSKVKDPYDNNEYYGEFHKNDFSIPIGISVEYANIVANVRYIFGLKDTNCSEWAKDKSIKNRSVWVTLGYRI